MLQLAPQVAQMCTASKHGAVSADQTRQPGPYSPGAPPTSPAPHHIHDTTPLEGIVLMPPPDPSPARNRDVYLLFAHAPYYPGPATQEINTTVVAADSLLHPQVCQPDGARIHDLGTAARRDHSAVDPHSRTARRCRLAGRR